MGLLSRYLAAGDPFDDRWYTAGPVVRMDDQTVMGDEAALKVSTVWRAVNVLAAGVAVLPIEVFRELGEGKGKKPARDDPWRRRLRRKPNKLQTTYRWRHHMMGHAVLGGNYYAHRIGEQLFPLDPQRMQVKDLLRDGSLLYRYTKKNGAVEYLNQDEVFHLRGFSRDGIVGISVLDVMRENTKLALTTKGQRTNFTKNQMMPSVVIKHPADLGDTGKENIQKGYQKAFGGKNVGGALVLDEGMEVSSFHISSRDAQWAEGEGFQVEEFLRFLGVPGVLVGHADKTATFASAEAFFQSFATHGVFPWTRNIEQELTAFLYGEEEDDITIEMDLNGLMRPTAEARAAFYRSLVEMGILTRNEVRELENRNPLPGLDEPLTPKNMGTGQDADQDDQGGGAPPKPGPPRPRPQSAPDEEEDARADRHGLVAGFRSREEEVARARAARAGLIAEGAAARLVRKEVSALQSLAKRYAADPEAWPSQLATFYEKHVALVVEAMQLELEQAAAYCERQRAEAAADLKAIEAWETTRPAELVALALGAAPPAPPGTTVTVPVTVSQPPAEVTVQPPAVIVRPENHVHVPAAAPPKGPQEMKIVGTVKTRVEEMPLPPEKDVEVTQRDPDGRIKRTRETPRKA